jgi:hypothetical protein
MDHLMIFIITDHRTISNNNGMLPCIYVFSRMMTEFGVFLDKQILYSYNITNKVESRFLMPVTGDEALGIDKTSFHFS